MALADQAIDRRVARVDNRGTQHEIFRRVSNERELRQDDKVGSIRRRAIAGAPDARKVTVDITYGGIQLCKRDGELQGWILRCARNPGATTNWNVEQEREPMRIGQSLACNRIPS